MSSFKEQNQITAAPQFCQATLEPAATGMNDFGPLGAGGLETWMGAMPLAFRVGQHEDKGAAFAEFRFHRNLAAVSFDNGSSDGQSQPGALMFTGG